MCDRTRVILEFLKDTIWVSAHRTLGLCVFPNIFAIYACKLTSYIPNRPVYRGGGGGGEPPPHREAT